MPLQNRVTPFGAIVALPERGLFTGNRGILVTAQVLSEASWACWSFGVTSAQADKYAGLWPAQSFQRHGISLVACELDRSALYREVAPLFVSSLVSLVDDARLEVELRGLERTPRAPGGSSRWLR